MKSRVIPVLQQANLEITQLNKCAPQILAYLQPYICDCYKQAIVDLYTRTRNNIHAHGALPVDELANSIVVKWKSQEQWQIEVNLDETLIKQWRTEDNEPIYQLGAHSHHSKRIVTSFTEHWRSPIGYMHELDWVAKMAELPIWQFLTNRETAVKIARICVPILKADSFHRAVTKPNRK